MELQVDVPKDESDMMSDALKVLLLEESDTEAARIIGVLHDGGFDAQFHHHSSGEGIETLLQEEDWDVILCADRIQDVSARYIIAFVRDLDLGIPIIIISDGVGEEQAVSLMRAGAHDFINKSNLTRLLPAIERELEEHTLYRQHQQTVTALHESEQYFRQLMNNVGGVFWLMDLKTGESIYVSPMFEEMWEYPVETMLESPEFLLDTIHPEDYFRVKDLLDERGWLGLNTEYRILLPDGDTRWVNTCSFPIRNRRGEVYRVASFSVDVTERRQLSEEREMMAMALQQSADAVIITDARAVIVYVNPAFEKITGYSAKEVIGSTPSILKSDLHDANFYRRVWNSLNNGIPFTDIFINRRKDGELYYEAKTITPVSGSNGEISYYVSTGKDITDRLKTRQQLHQLAHFDAVTGLANHILLKERLEQAIVSARACGGSFSVMSVALELSKLLGDIPQKTQAERLLQQVAQRLTDSLHPTATVAHLDNNEFVVVFKVGNTRTEIESEVRAMMMAFTRPVSADGYELFLTPSIGISIYPTDAVDGDTLLKHSEAAMQRARLHGHGTYTFYQDGSPQRIGRLSS